MPVSTLIVPLLNDKTSRGSIIVIPPLNSPAGLGAGFCGLPDPKCDPSLTCISGTPQIFVASFSAIRLYLGRGGSCSAHTGKGSALSWHSVALRGECPIVVCYSVFIASRLIPLGSWISFARPPSGLLSWCRLSPGYHLFIHILYTYCT